MENNKDQAAQSQPAPQPGNAAQNNDSRQEAIEQENDTARLRSERQSVEDGSGSTAPQP